MQVNRRYFTRSLRNLLSVLRSCATSHPCIDFNWPDHLHRTDMQLATLMAITVAHRSLPFGISTFSAMWSSKIHVSSVCRSMLSHRYSCMFTVWAMIVGLSRVPHLYPVSNWIQLAWTLSTMAISRSREVELGTLYMTRRAIGYCLRLPLKNARLPRTSIKRRTHKVQRQ